MQMPMAETMELLARPDTDRVRAKTADKVNERIDEQTIEHLCNYVGLSNEMISRRIAELDREWDIERWLEANASSIAFAGVLMGIVGKRKWLMVPAVVLPFLFLHATQGWSPPVPLLRRFG